VGASCGCSRAGIPRSRHGPATGVAHTEGQRDNGGGRDVLDRASLDTALDGVETADYPVHSMGSETASEEADRRDAASPGLQRHAAGHRRRSGSPDRSRGRQQRGRPPGTLGAYLTRAASVTHVASVFRRMAPIALV
jgi:hypothetical protein